MMLMSVPTSTFLCCSTLCPYTYATYLACWLDKQPMYHSSSLKCKRGLSDDILHCCFCPFNLTTSVWFIFSILIHFLLVWTMPNETTPSHTQSQSASMSSHVTSSVFACPSPATSPPLWISRGSYSSITCTEVPCFSQTRFISRDCCSVLMIMRAMY